MEAFINETISMLLLRINYLTKKPQINWGLTNSSWMQYFSA